MDFSQIQMIIERNLQILTEVQKEHENHQQLFNKEHSQISEISDVFLEIQNIVGQEYGISQQQ